MMTIANHLAIFINHAVLAQKTVSRPQPAVVDKLHHGIQLLQEVFQRRSRQHQGKGGTQAFQDAAGFGFPILDALPFIQEYQIPTEPFQFRGNRAIAPDP